MLMKKYGRRAVGLAAVLAIALIGAVTVGLWSGAVGPASTDAEVVEPAAVLIGEAVSDVDSAAAVNAARCECYGHPTCNCPPCWPRTLIDDDCDACCWSCDGGEIFCQE